MRRLVLLFLILPVFHSQEQDSNEVLESTAASILCVGDDCSDKELLETTTNKAKKSEKTENKVTPSKIKVKEKEVVLSDVVLHKFKVLMEHMFASSHNRDFFDVLASPRPLAIFRLPAGGRFLTPLSPEQRLFTTSNMLPPFEQSRFLNSDNSKQRNQTDSFSDKTSFSSQPLENPRDSEEERQFLRETAYQPQDEQKTWSDYDRYWRQYYANSYGSSPSLNYNYRQPQYFYDSARAPYDYYSNTNSYSQPSYGSSFVHQTYNPSLYGQSSYGPQSYQYNIQSSPYFSGYNPQYSQNYAPNYQTLGVQSGLNVGLGNGMGFGISSGIGFNMGK